MTNNAMQPLLERLNFPDPALVQLPEVRDEYTQFLAQLVPVAGGDVVLSNPYFFEIAIDEITSSTEAWFRNRSPEQKTKLLLLSLFCRPLHSVNARDDDEEQPLDASIFRLLWGRRPVSLAEGTSGIPFGIDCIDERRRAFNDPGLKLLLDTLPNHSVIETIASEFMDLIPGNYSDQAWQIADWSSDWAVVYGLCDAGHEEGYPFPWLLGFCHKDNLERNFISLLREGSALFDLGFYCTYGDVSSEWRLANLALSMLDEDLEPRSAVVEELLSLDDNLLEAILAEGPDDPKGFLSRIDAILRAADEPEVFSDSLPELLEQVDGPPWLAAIERQLREWQGTCD